MPDPNAELFPFNAALETSFDFNLTPGSCETAVQQSVPLTIAEFDAFLAHLGVDQAQSALNGDVLDLFGFEAAPAGVSPHVQVMEGPALLPPPPHSSSPAPSPPALQNPVSSISTVCPNYLCI